MKRYLFILFMFVSVLCIAQNNNSLVNFKNPASSAVPRSYSKAVSIDLGNCFMIMISGQTSRDDKGNFIGKGDFAKQAEQVFLNIKSIVSEAGGNMNDVVKMNIYLVDNMHYQPFREIRSRFVHPENPPAATLVYVKSLGTDVMLEIEAIAVIPKR